MANDLVSLKLTGWSVKPQTYEEFISYCQSLSQTVFCPPALKDKPHDIMAVIQLGDSLNVPPVQFLSAIQLIPSNGVLKPSIGGDIFRGLVLKSPLLEAFNERLLESSTGTFEGFECMMKRRGQEPYTFRYTMAMAKVAGLSEKANWKSSPWRMCQHKAFNYVARSVLPDVIWGAVAIVDEDGLFEEASYQIIEDVGSTSSESGEVKSSSNVDKLKMSILEQLGDDD